MDEKTKVVDVKAIEDKLEELYELEQVYKEKSKEHDAKSEEIYPEPVVPPEIQAQLDALQEAWSKFYTEYSEKTGALENEIKVMTQDAGETQKSLHKMAVFSQKADEVNLERLKGVALMVPQVKECITPGTTYVSIRDRK